MKKKILLTILLFLFSLPVISSPALTATKGQPCTIIKTQPEGNCNDPKFYCKPAINQPKKKEGIFSGSCEDAAIRKIFGKIQPPQIIEEFLQNEPTGTGAISQFLSNFIALLFGIAAVVLIFMIIWGAFDWTTSGGDKEKLASAQKRIINAIIGILLFSLAFAAITVLGRFTGFTLFRGQNYLEIERNSLDIIWRVKCKDGKWHFPKSTAAEDTDPDEICRNL